MPNDDVWISLRAGVESLILEAAAGDAAVERFLRRKLENWAITKGSGRVTALKDRLKKQIYREQEGNCAECGEPLTQKFWELDRLNPSFADDPDQGYRLGNVRGVHPQCNPRGPYPGGRARRLGR